MLDSNLPADLQDIWWSLIQKCFSRRTRHGGGFWQSLLGTWRDCQQTISPPWRPDWPTRSGGRQRFGEVSPAAMWWCMYWEQLKKRKGNMRFKDLESITSDFHTCRGTGRAAQQDGSDGGGWEVQVIRYVVFWLSLLQFRQKWKFQVSRRGLMEVAEKFTY